MASNSNPKFASLSIVIVSSIAIVGYFVGLQSPMNPSTSRNVEPKLKSQENLILADTNNRIIPATHYSQMGAVNEAFNEKFFTSLKDLKQPASDTKIDIPFGAKTFALKEREKNRAFNGAPPTVPHPVDQISSAACIACHGKGMRTKSLRIPMMSHQFLENCTQCHVENNPRHIAPSVFRGNSFVGIPAPQKGDRAFAGAPPTIPHTTWMRVNCLSCHGFAGYQGMKTTHPWRQNCQQCHAPSSKLDQVQLSPDPKFLAPIQIIK